MVQSIPIQGFDEAALELDEPIATQFRKESANGSKIRVKEITLQFIRRLAQELGGP
jgi:translation initiation factor 1 (eIF-1/SUI1)